MHKILLIYNFQIFEWWYFKKYGTSFIEQVSLNHISPLLGGGDGSSADINSGNATPSTSVSNTATSDATRNASSQQSSIPGNNCPLVKSDKLKNVLFLNSSIS